MRQRGYLLLLLSYVHAGFIIKSDVETVGLGRTIVVSTDASVFPLSPLGTVLWPFVNGSQWGAFVTCAVTNSSSNACSLILPLPFVGVASIQLAVLKEGRNWCQAGNCVYPAGTPFPLSSVVMISNILSISVVSRKITRPSLPPGRSACMDYESWFTPHNFQAWLPRPGASGIPIVGMYNSSNTQVMRQHLIWFAEAGVDCLLLDWSNNLWGGIPWADRAVNIQEIINVTTLLIDQIDQTRKEGVIPVPRVVIMVGLVNGPPADPKAVSDEIKWILNNYVQKYTAQDSFLKVGNDPRPVIVVLDTGTTSTPKVNLTSDFAVRWMGTQLQNDPQLGSKYGFWSWMDGVFAPLPALRPDGSAEALTVTPGFFAGGGWLAPTAAGQHDGSTFIRTMQAALKYLPSVLLICQWNEFAGQPGGPSSNFSFVDIYNGTFSNDMEPVSLTECAFTREGDRGQLPVCNTGWGFFDLNILSASMAVYREALSNGTSRSSVVAIVSPSTGDSVSAAMMTVRWTAIGAASVFNVSIDGTVLAQNVKCCEAEVDGGKLSVGAHSLEVVACDGFSRFLLSRSQVDEPLTTPIPAAAIITFYSHAAPPLPTVSTTATGFASLSAPTSYEYGPSIIQENGTFYNFYCSPPASSQHQTSHRHQQGENGGSWDSIRLVTSQDGQTWSNQQIILEGIPQDKWSSNSTCDPSIVKFKGVYFLYHTCINVFDPPDKYTNNRICVALSDHVTGPYKRFLAPVIQNLNCSLNYQSVYCVGQPSAIVDHDRGVIVVFYSSIGAPGDPTQGPNPGQILAQESLDGVHFTPYGGQMYAQHNGDIKFDRTSQTYVMVQGDVGSTRLSYSLSNDKQTWLPFEFSSPVTRTVQTNPKLPSPCVPPCSNNNPGLASLPDGSFSGSTFVLYGSSYPAQDPWGSWHLYRSEMVLNSEKTDCNSCAPNGCDLACSQLKRVTSTGTCAFPGSKDPAHCCTCGGYEDPSPCKQCAPLGCVTACFNAGHKAGACAAGKDPADCCVCFD